MQEKVNVRWFVPIPALGPGRTLFVGGDEQEYARIPQLSRPRGCQAFIEPGGLQASLHVRSTGKRLPESRETRALFLGATTIHRGKFA